MQQALDAAYLAQHRQQEATYSSIDEYLYTRGCPPVDLLIRTSGEQRLSDFMLRQSSHALLIFTGVLWPDFGFLDLISAIIHYQKKHTTLEASRKAGAASVAHLLEQQQQQQREHLPKHLIRLKLPITARVPCAIEVDSPCSVTTPDSCSLNSQSEGSNRSAIELSSFDKDLVPNPVEEDAGNHPDALLVLDVAPLNSSYPGL
jgi:hypothetical protein